MKNNFGYKVLAVFLAILLWLYVTNQQNPLSEATYTVPLDVKNLPAKLVVAEKTPQVTVRLMARQHLLEKISTKDLQAYLDLRNAKQGENKAEISVSAPKDTQVVSITPAKGDVTLTSISSRQLSVRVKLVNPVPEGYVMFSQQLTPSQVVVSGPLNILDKISNAVVSVDLVNQKVNYIQRLPIRIYDDEGNDLTDWLKVKPDIAEAFIAISPVQPRKQMAVKPTFSGSLPNNMVVARVVVEPQLVTVTGGEASLNNMFVATTKPIELSDKSTSFATEVLLDLPEGVTAYPTPKVRVTVDVTK